MGEIFSFTNLATGSRNPYHNLPTPLSSFVGRERVLGQIKGLLTSTRLLTLTGAGGIGKTRLALQTALNLQHHYKDGACLVELASISEPTRLVGTIARALSVREEPGSLLLTNLITFLQEKELLLVLDNCEHLIEECALVTEALLKSCSRLFILATSREAISISGETTLRAPSLSLPPEPTTLYLPLSSSKYALDQFEAVQLFLERVHAVQPGFEVTEYNSRSIAQICLRLDGIPLALELAAARSKALSMEQIAARLDDRFRLLTGGNRTALPRQQTLQALLDWSNNLLPEPEKVLLRRLAVFTGSFSLAAAEEVCCGDFLNSSERGWIRSEQVSDLVWQLVNKSLVVSQEAPNEGDKSYFSGEMRYWLLETIRQYSQQNLEAASETEKYRRQHRDWYLKLTEKAGLHLQEAEQHKWFAQLELEQANLNAALGWSLQHGEVAEAARMAIGLWNYWHTHIRFEDMRWLEQIQARSEQIPLPAELQARFFNILGNANHAMLNNYERSLYFHQKALGLWQQLGDKNGISSALMDIGWHYFIQMKLEEAARYADEGLVVARELGSNWTIAAALHLKGMSLFMMGKYEQVIPLVEQSLSIWRESGDKGSLASSLGLLGQILVAQGNYEQARPVVDEALALQLEMGSLLGMSVSIQIMAEIAVNAKTQPEGALKASRLMGISDSWYRDIRGPMPPLVAAIRGKVSGVIKTKLAEEDYIREFEAGKVLTRAEFMVLAGEVTGPESKQLPVGPSIGPVPEIYPAGLTGREVEVLQLVATGLSNPQIAEKLVLSRRTVEAHLHTIFGKIEVTSRVEATRFALNNGLA